MPPNRSAGAGQSGRASDRAGTGRSATGRRAADRPAASALDPQSLLERAALRHLDRFETSSANLKTVLMRAARGNVETDVASRMVDELLARYEGSGLVDDRRFAINLAGSLRRRGASRRAIEHKLHARRLKPSAIAAALESMDQDAGSDGDVEAARTFARRRRLGPHRPEAERLAHQRRDFAAMARAGFSLETSRIALQADAAPDDVF
jgi:regulatory protein